MIRLRNERSDFSPSVARWMTINTVRGAQASAVIYRIIEIAKANGLNVYYYIKYLPKQLVALINEQENIEQSEQEPLTPWSKTLPSSGL